MGKPGYAGKPGRIRKLAWWGAAARSFGPCARGPTPRGVRGGCASARWSTGAVCASEGSRKVQKNTKNASQVAGAATRTTSSRAWVESDHVRAAMQRACAFLRFPRAPSLNTGCCAHSPTALVAPQALFRAPLCEQSATCGRKRVRSKDTAAAARLTFQEFSKKSWKL